MKTENSTKNFTAMFCLIIFVMSMTVAAIGENYSAAIGYFNACIWVLNSIYLLNKNEK